MECDKIINNQPNIKTVKDLENMEFKRYFIDVDGVIIHSVKATTNILNKKYNMNIKPQDIKSWNFIDKYPMMTEEEIEWIFTTNEFFDNVEFIKGAKKFMLKHSKDVILITKGQRENIKQKRIMLDLNGLEDIELIGIPLYETKDIINMKSGVFIDDTTKNLNEVTTADYKVLFKEYDNYTEWSEGWNGNVMYSWE